MFKRDTRKDHEVSEAIKTKMKYSLFRENASFPFVIVER